MASCFACNSVLSLLKSQREVEESEVLVAINNQCTSSQSSLGAVDEVKIYRQLDPLAQEYMCDMFFPSATC